MNPHRAFRLTMVIDADDLNSLAGMLNSIAIRVSHNELTTGVSGGVDSGVIYELLHDPHQTHDNYFREIADRLAQEVN